MSEPANRREQVSRLSNHLIRNSVHFAVLAALAAGGIATRAQAQAAPAPADEAPLQEVVVTGTMIKRSNAETSEAVTILKADALREQGITNVEQILDTVSANNSQVNFASAVGSFSGGGTYANLRDLGSSRTLILLDGQRLAPNANTGGAVDLSGIPFSAIQQVEVLREGASALYGTDAIAGVINFITKKDFEGAQIQANFDRPQRNGGAAGQMDFSFGHGNLASDGYNIMLTGSYSKQQELRATQRPFSADGFDPARGYTSTNYDGNWPGDLLDANGNEWQTGYPACAGNSEVTRYFGDCSYRYSAATDLLPKVEEYSGLAAITKALPANNKISLQYFYTQAVSTGWSGPMFYAFPLNTTNPFIPPANTLVCSRGPANCDAPPDVTDPVTAIWSDPYNDRYNGTINVAQRAVLTFSGTNAGWDYSAQLNYSKDTNDNRNVGGYPNEDVLAPGGTLSDLINPFGAQPAAGQALINSSYVNGVYALGKDSRWSMDASATHQLGDAFNSGTPASVAVGIDITGEHFHYATTPYNDITAAATGLTDSTVNGSRQTQAAFIEVDLPVAKSVDLDISDREDRYSDFGRTNNGKVSVRYQPFNFLTFRGNASTGFRAPRLYDLYSSNFIAASSSGTMGSGNPDCAGGVGIAPFTSATCAKQGIALRGGNANLTPETSQNFDLGMIVSPIQDLGITLDYFRVLLKNTIGTIPTSAIYGNPTLFAPYYVLDTTGGLTPTVNEGANCIPYTLPTCGYIVRTNQNTGRITTSGLDVSIQYTQHTPIGTFHEDLEGTATTQFLQQQYSGGKLINLVGHLQIDQFPPAYRWSHSLKIDWSSPEGMFGAGATHRLYSTYIDEFKLGPDNDGAKHIVGTYSTIDVYASVKPVEKLTVLFGIKNVFDHSPPYTNAFQDNFAAGYNALNVDPLLRNFYVNLKYVIF